MSYTVERRTTFHFKCDRSQAWINVAADTLGQAYQIIAGYRWTVQVRADADWQLCPVCSRKPIQEGNS